MRSPKIVSAVSSSATAHLEAMRDQWLHPLVERIKELPRKTGRREHERDSLRVELDRMRVVPEVLPGEPERGSHCRDQPEEGTGLA